MLQKNAFGQKRKENSCTGSKVPFWKSWRIASELPWLKSNFLPTKMNSPSSLPLHKAKWQNIAGSKKYYNYEPKMSSASTVFSFEHTAQFITSLSMGFPNCLCSYFFRHTCAQKSLNWPLLPIGARNPSPADMSFWQ